MTAPQIDFRAIAHSTDKLEVLREIARQGHRVGPLTKGSIDGSLVPMRHGLGDDAWKSATNTLTKNFESLFYDEDVFIGVAGGSLQVQEWYYCDGKSLSLVDRYDRRVPAPQERRLDFTPRQLPDLKAPAVRCEKIRAAINELADQQARIVDKIDGARKEIRRHQENVNNHQELSSEIREAKALAFINDDAVDLQTDEKKLAALGAQVRKSASLAAAATEAIKILEAKALRATDMTASLQKDLESAEATWLMICKAHTFETFRKQLHDLHRTIAYGLAIESKGPFNRGEPMWDFVAALGEAIPAHADYRPGWLGTSRPSLFPGFANAMLLLEESLVALGQEERADLSATLPKSVA